MSGHVLMEYGMKEKSGLIQTVMVYGIGLIVMGMGFVIVILLNVKYGLIKQHQFVVKNGTILMETAFMIHLDPILVITLVLD